MSLNTLLLQLQKLLEIPEYHPPLLPAVNEVSSKDLFPSTIHIEHLVAEESFALRQIDEIARRIQDIELAVSSAIAPATNELASRRMDLETRVKAARCLRAPIQKVPDDVLAHIFAETAALTTQELLMTGATEWDISTVLRVCHRWNEVSRSTPTMWNDLFPFTDSSERFHRFAIARLPLAKKTFLSVNSVKFDFIRHRFEFSHSDTHPAMRLLPLFRVHKQRIVTLKLNIGILSSNIGPLDLSFPELRWLELITHCDIFCDDCHPLLEACTLDVPQLRALTVTHPRLIPLVKGCRSIRSLRLAYMGTWVLDDVTTFVQHVVRLAPQSIDLQLRGSYTSTLRKLAGFTPLEGLMNIINATIVAPDTICEELLSSISHSVQTLRMYLPDKPALELLQSTSHLRCLSWIIGLHNNYTILCEEAPSASNLARAIMHIPQFDLYWPDERIDERIKTTVVEAIGLRFGTAAPSPRTTMHPAAVRLDCLSMRITDFSDSVDILPLIEEQMQALAYRRLSEPHAERLFWLHPEFRGTPFMWDAALELQGLPY